MGDSYIYDGVMTAPINQHSTVYGGTVCDVCVSDVRGGVDGGVSRRTLWDTGPVVDDVFVAAQLPVLV